jgi:hypothetical protein
MTRRPLTGSINYHAEFPLDVFAADVLIPNKETVERNKYPFVIIDAATEYMFVSLHRHKSDATPHAIAIIKQEQVAHGLTSKRLHSGNDGELKNHVMTDFLVSQGTVQTYSTAHTPQHTFIERHVRTLNEMVRCVMHQCNAYVPLYGEAYLFCVFNKNRTVTTKNSQITPYENYKGWKPSMKYIHVWGSDAHYHRHEQQRNDKFSARSKKGIFVGYSVNNDSYYRVYNVDARVIVITRDVKIFDNQFDEMKRAVSLAGSSNDDIDEVIPSNGHHDESENDEDGEGGDDALPDSALNDDEVLQSMFPTTSTHTHEHENENENENEMNVDEPSSSLSSPSSSSTNIIIHSCS